MTIRINVLTRIFPIFLLIFSITAHASWDDFWYAKWSGAVYYGKFTKNTLGQVIGCSYQLDKDKLYSAEIARYFHEDGPVRRYWGPMVDEIGLVFNFTLHDDHNGTIYEFIPYITGKWKILPDNPWVKARIIIGEGPSWVSKTPHREGRNSRDPQKLLNYLMFELSLAPAKHPEIELTYRIHHRSGVFGLYGANNSGSTAVGLVLRYYIDYSKKPPKKCIPCNKPPRIVRPDAKQNKKTPLPLRERSAQRAG